MRGDGLKDKIGPGLEDVRRSRVRYLLAVAFAAALSLGIAVPAFGVQETPGGNEPDIQPNIVGGTAVPDGKYRFIAAVRNVQNGSTAYQQQYCGGTLIDRDSVLTAGHCVQGQLPQILRVTVGRTALNSSQGQTRRVKRIFIHPKYKGVTNEAYDAAVLKLGSPINGITPARIPRSSSNGFETPGRLATIAGWGSTVRQPPNGGNDPSFPDRMREAQVPIVSDTTAASSYPSYRPLLMLAAGEEGKDTCQGDSGGPIFVPTSTGRYQIGITSFGAGCGARGFPGVYTEANSSYIRPFIFNAAGR